AWRERCDNIRSFERQLAEDGAVIVKFWLHISRKEQGRRFERLQADPVSAWQVTGEDLWQHKHYGRVYDGVEDIIARTDAPFTPWIVLPATDWRFAWISMLETVVGALGRKLGVDPTA